MMKKSIALSMAFVLLFSLIGLMQGYAQQNEVVVSTPDGASIVIDYINEARADGSIGLFSRDFGVSTAPFGLEDQLLELTVANGTIVDIVEGDANGSYIPPNGYVISAKGSARSELEAFTLGQSLVLTGYEPVYYPEQYFTIQNVTIPITAVNPAVRTAAAVALFNNQFPWKETGTNPYGIELTVIDGLITRFDDYNPSQPQGNNSPIPSNGVVISIHIDSPYLQAVRTAAREAIESQSVVDIVLDNVPMYGAGHIATDTVNPTKREDNPSGWDHANNAPYPGFRGADQLIVYTSAYGQPATGTNPYGYEIAVDHTGRIMSAGGNNSVIPDNGFVLSGHGVKADFLQRLGKIGGYAHWDGELGSVTVQYKPDAFVAREQHRVHAAEQALETAYQQFRDIDKAAVREKISEAEQKVTEAASLIEAKHFRAGMVLLREAEAASQIAYYRTFESRRVEDRAAWIRPVEKSRAEIEKVLDDLLSVNINKLYVEIDYDGHLIFPSSNGLVTLNPAFNGLDVLGTYVEEGKKRNIEIHAWGKTLFVRPPQHIALPREQEATDDTSYAQTWDMYKNGWLMANKQGKHLFRDSAYVHFYFLSPSHPEAMSWLAGVYREIAEKYDVDGIQVDYVRYPSEDPYYQGQDPGYESISSDLFKLQTGKDPLELAADDPLFKKWNEFRINLINQVLYNIADAVKEGNADLEFLAAVWPYYPRAKSELYQDAINWVERGYLDNIGIMTYNPGTELPVKDTIDALKFAKGKAAVMTGLAAYIGSSKEMLVEQIDAVREAADADGSVHPANGVAIFEYETLFKIGYDEALREGVFKDAAITVGREPDKAVKLIYSEIIRKIDSLYVPGQGMRAKDAEKYKKELNKMMQNVDKNWNKGKKKSKLDKSLKGIDKFKKDLNKDKHLHEQVKARISTDLIQAHDIIKLAMFKKS